MAVGRLPESGADLCSQPTISRLENLPGTTALKRMMAAMIELFCDSFTEVPRRIVLDIDDTEDRVHGGQQLSLFHAHYDSRCFLPMHIYEATTGKPVAVILRPGKTPSGAEVALVLRHVVKAIRRRWPRVDILIRGDSHYARHEAMTWCEHNRVGYVFGLAGNQVLLGRVAQLAEDAAVARVEGDEVWVDGAVIAKGTRHTLQSLEEEFEAIGVPFNERVERTEEYMQALRALWSEIEAGRLAGQGRFVGMLGERGALRPGLSVDEARDGLDQPPV